VAEVRRATVADIEALVELARELHAEAPTYRDEPFEPVVLQRWLLQRIGSTMLVDDNAVFVAVRDGAILGVLIGMVVPRWFNRLRIAAELTLYVKPEYRGGRTLPALVRAFKAWAKEQGATKATLGISTGIQAERTVRAYARMGFTLDGYIATTDL
jgi:RimJ/RimL family protein N-acetyltransferase